MALKKLNKRRAKPPGPVMSYEELVSGFRFAEITVGKKNLRIASDCARRSGTPRAVHCTRLCATKFGLLTERKIEVRSRY